MLKKRYKYYFYLSGFIGAVFLNSCKQSDVVIPQSDSNSDFMFSGIAWNLKSDDKNMLGPGPNFFSDSSANVWLDNTGALHLKITNRNGEWQCPEIISKEKCGYGTYEFTMASNLITLNEKVVLGLFTWDDTAFYTQANSEVDIEFSKWGVSSQTRTLTYTVQPYWWNNPIPYYERQNVPTISAGSLDSLSTHSFNWTDSLIVYKSYKGEGTLSANQIASWQLANTTPYRRKIESIRQSFPVSIPAPGGETHARINLWLLGGAPPTDNQEVEVIIKSFKFTPD